MAAEEKARIKALHDVCRHFGKTKSHQTHEGPDGSKEVINIEDDSPPDPPGKRTTAHDLSSLFGFRLTESKAIIEGNDPLTYIQVTFPPKTNNHCNPPLPSPPNLPPLVCNSPTPVDTSIMSAHFICVPQVWTVAAAA